MASTGLPYYEGGNEAIIRANLEDMPEIRQWVWTD